MYYIRMKKIKINPKWKHICYTQMYGHKCPMMQIKGDAVHTIYYCKFLKKVIDSKTMVLDPFVERPTECYKKNKNRLPKPVKDSGWLKKALKRMGMDCREIKQPLYDNESISVQSMKNIKTIFSSNWNLKKKKRSKYVRRKI